MKIKKNIISIETVFSALAGIAILILITNQFPTYLNSASVFLLLGTAIFYFIATPIYCYDKEQTLLCILSGLLVGFVMAINLLSIIYLASKWPGAPQTVFASIGTTFFFGGISMLFLLFFIKKGKEVGKSLLVRMLFSLSLVLFLRYVL